MKPIPDVIRSRFQNARRAEVRREAAARAKAMLGGRRDWDGAALHELIGILQTDWFNGKLLHNRFSPGLIGQHEKWLLESMGAVGQWLSAVGQVAAAGIDDAKAAELLASYWEKEVKGPYVFPTAVLMAVEPERFVVLTKPTQRAAHALFGDVPKRRSLDAGAYLAVCERLRALCRAEGWPLCLVDSALHLPAEPEASSGPRFEGYSAATVDFLRALPAHTSDPEWHVANKETYQTVLRDPTLALVEEIGARFIAALDGEVAEADRPTSILKKNDFGGDTYHAHYWFAFYDPAAEKKTQSAQLFAIFDAAADEVRHGVGVGAYGRTYHDRLLAAFRDEPDAAAAQLDALPAGFEVCLVYKEGADVSRPVGDLAAALRSGQLETFLGAGTKLEAIEIRRRERSLDFMVKAGRDLVDVFGRTFVALWPLFQAARTGRFEIAAAVDSPAPAPSIAGASAGIEDDSVPASLADLSTVTSVSEETLEEIEEALLARGQIILTGPPGTSKTYIAQQFARYFAHGEVGGRPDGSVHVMYLHSGWAYEDFFEGVRPKVGGAGLEFAVQQGAFLTWVEEHVRRVPKARHVLVLDEINRCDTAAVLGELLQLMEYRGQPVKLLSGRSFVMPRRLYLIGTMNSADRSIGRLDLALRRRFHFIDLLPDPDVLQTWLQAVPARNPSGFDAEALRECNAYLQDKHRIPPEQQVGHALFMPPTTSGDASDEEGALTPAVVRRIVEFGIKPYVRELLVERGRDPSEALATIASFFAAFTAEANAEADAVD